MTFGALGDIHGDFASVRRIIERHADVPFWLCVGDVADDDGAYEPIGAALYWIKGNNENFDAIAADDFPPDFHHIPNGSEATVGDLRIAGLGGTFAPTMFELAPGDLPHPKKGTAKATALADRRRHFVRTEVESCKRLPRGVDILLTHEAPSPFQVTAFAGRRPNDAGKGPITEVIAALQPRLHLFGHHHRFAEHDVHGVRSVCLDLVSRSYLLIDGRTLKYDVVS
ncbi:MAG: metallophosphoesterase [Acidobacteriota bacterium]|nr:metallophosphoesterase [Acidobacteriota bacterium]